MRTTALLLARRACASTAGLAKTRAGAWAPASALGSEAFFATASHQAWPAMATAPAWRGLASSASPPPPGKDGEDGDASHDDFKPTFRGDAGGAPASTADIIKADIEGHRVFVYMKVQERREREGGRGCERGRRARRRGPHWGWATQPGPPPLSLSSFSAPISLSQGEPEAPQCGFSNMVCRILDAYGVDYGSRNVLADPEIREGIKAFTGWPTIPQVFARAEFLGGADILMALHNAGELEAALSGGGDKAGGDGHVHGPGCNH